MKTIYKKLPFNKSILFKFLALAFILGFYFFPSSVKAEAGECLLGTTLNIVAHEDDDLLFLNPDIQNDIRAGRCVISVFLTAGDANQGTLYWQGREDGEKAAYSIMNSALNFWTQQDAGISGHPIPVFTLTTKPNTSLVFLRLPDGNYDGTGFSSNNFQSLQKLWQEAIPTMTTVDLTSNYTKQGLINTLLALMNKYKPDIIRTQNFIDPYNSAVDHSDHYTTAYLAKSASQLYLTSHILIGYYDYEINSQSQNIFGTDATAKQDTFISYAQYDPNVCQTVSTCLNTKYGGWFVRQYTISSPTPTPISTTITPTPTIIPSPPPVNGTELLTNGVWTFSGTNATEHDTRIPETVIQDMSTVLVNFDLHGTKFGTGDDEASIIFIQNNDWYSANLILFGINGFDGLQTIQIPLTYFHKVGNQSMLLDPTKSVTNLHSRFWNSATYNVEINSVTVFINYITPTPTVSPTPTPTATATPTIIPTMTPTPTPTPTTLISGTLELLPSTWTLTGSNGPAEKNMGIAANSLLGKSYVSVTFNLHGTKFGTGDDEASIIFIQNKEWRVANLLKYGINGLNNLQTVVIPLTDFHKVNSPSVKLDTTLPVTDLHTRFWNKGSYSVDITSVNLLSNAITPTPTLGPSPSPTTSPTPSATPTPTPTPTSSGSIELLSGGTWTLSGSNSSAEKNMGIGTNILSGKNSALVKYDLHGTKFGTGDDEASVIFIQKGIWYAVNIIPYGANGLNGLQTINIPLTSFHKVGSPSTLLDLTSVVSDFHVRFWNKNTFNIDLYSVLIQ